ncbi:protein kinase [Streptomyces sp. NPDC046881]|uniref:serine/threonine-protein kinase n=1 Tax=Streptomyces sp. NPDC046881 TaxID=3155374 RepID=UPI0033E7B73E
MSDIDPTSIGHYRIVGRLGDGGMGRVYLGRSPGGRAVAVKVVHPQFASDREFRRRFAREVEAARRVSGVFTAPVVDADPEGSPPWLATAYIPGVSLHDAVACHGALPTASVLGLGAGVVEALKAIHEAGLVHRDLKPSNVLLASDGPRVIDFGIALASEASALTRTGTTMGSPSFMAPEQISGDRPVGPASDVFSLGSMLVFAATGEGPFGSGPVHSLLFRIVHQEAAMERVPTELREILAPCLRKDPDQRPSVNDLLTDLTTRLTVSPEDATVSLHNRGWLPDTLARTILGRIGADLALSDPSADTEILRGIGPDRTLIDNQALLGTGNGAAEMAARLKEQTEAECAEMVAQARTEASLILAKAARDAQAKREEADALFEETRAKAAQAAADFETNLAKRRRQSEMEIPQARTEASLILAKAAQDAQAKREEADALFEETRAKAAQAAADFETNLAKRREQSERDLASRQQKAEKRLTEIEHRAEQLRLEAEKLRTDAERRARQTVETAQRQADDIRAGVFAPSERDLAKRQGEAYIRLAETEERAETLRLEAEKLRTDAERRARQVVEAAEREAEDIRAGALETVVDSDSTANRGTRWFRRH